MRENYQGKDCKMTRALWTFSNARFARTSYISQSSAPNVKKPFVVYAQTDGK